MPLQWNGTAILAKVKAAEAAGVQETAEAIATEAKNRVHVDSGDLKNSIDVLGVATDGEGVSAQVGSESDHAIYQEVGVHSKPSYGFTPYLRPSLDIHGKRLAANIKKRM